VPRQRRDRDGDTAARILDTAERLAQTRGFNGFSYADIAAELGITTASVHYHFAGKAQLGTALIERYRARFGEALAAMDADNLNGRAKLDSYVAIYADVLRGRRMCLCGMLAAEFETLPSAMQQAVVRFFDENETWLVRVLEEGRADGSLRFAGDPAAAARTLVGGLEGAMLVARPYDDLERFQSVAGALVGTLVAP
jgi:TetR/AcrR family transcriptional repressor of nem operon